MIGGRGIGDGVTFFGSSTNQENKENENGDKNKLKVDFILNLNEKYSYPFIFSYNIIKLYP